MSDTGDSANMARLWIGTHVALFVVMVISAVLLVVMLLTLIFYCWCCRRKVDHWQRESKADKSDGSQIGLHGDSLDAESAATANIRGSGAFEIQVETKPKINQPPPDYPGFAQQQFGQQMSASNPEPVASQGKGIGLEEVRIQQVELRLEASAHVATQVQQHYYQLELPAVKANEAVEDRQRLPRTLVIPETQSNRRSHGSSVYQSDENEITIVDSDFSDYEDNHPGAMAKKGKKRSQMARTDQWETLPNQRMPGEASIHAVNRWGVEYVPAPAESLAEQRARRADNLADLDRTLDVFAQQVLAGNGRPGGYRDPSPGGYVDEEEVRPIDRSQVLF